MRKDDGAQATNALRAEQRRDHANAYIHRAADQTTTVHEERASIRQLHERRVALAHIHVGDPELVRMRPAGTCLRDCERKDGDRAHDEHVQGTTTAKTTRAQQ